MFDLIFVIIIFSIIQSMFGVGLLLFGTPTLLLLGYSYTETLWILLPCSLIISLIQTLANFDLVKAKKKVVYFTIPTMAISLFLIISYEYLIDVTKIVGFFLVFIAIVNFFPNIKSYLVKFINRYLRSYYFFIGFVHGVSNMGGGPISVLMSSIYHQKDKIRVNIAFIYLLLSSFQIIVLFFIGSSNLITINVNLILVSLCSYLLSNYFFYQKVDDRKYTFLINGLIMIYGLIALLK